MSTQFNLHCVSPDAIPLYYDDHQSWRGINIKTQRKTHINYMNEYYLHIWYVHV